jgi:hypothetical protein
MSLQRSLRFVALTALATVCSVLIPSGTFARQHASDASGPISGGEFAGLPLRAEQPLDEVQTLLSVVG